MAWTVAVVDEAGLAHPLRVTDTEYVPLAVVAAPGIEGFCCVEINPFGPVQLYVAPATVVAVRFSVEPAHTAPPLPAVTVGIALIVAVVVEAGLVHPFSVTVAA